MKKEKFGFKNLDVWQKSVAFAIDVINICEKIDTERKHYRLIEQVESSSTSIAANIAEGKGRYSKKEFIQFLYISRGSLFETVTFLTIFKHKGWITEADLEKFNEKAAEIGKMLSSLINKIKENL
jgi:four helix bundle protein